MANLNKVMLIGNLTRDPEVKYTPKGSAVADFGLAINRYYTTESGEKREEVTFIDVSLWGKQADLAKQYLTKGRPVYIEGRLQMDTWDDKQTGQKRSKLKVIGEQMQFIGTRADNEGGGGEGGGKSSGGSRESQGGGDEYDQRPQRSQPPQQRNSGGGSYQQGGGAQRGGGKPQPAAASPEVEDDDDIPF